MKSKSLVLLAPMIMLSLCLNAQPQDHERPAPPKRMTPEEIAQKGTEQMKAEVGLTEKQYKKVYNLIKKDHEYRQNQAENMFAGGMPPQGGMGQGPRPEGGPGMGPGGDIVTDEYLEKQDKKLQKILTAEQYSMWRSKHPAEHMELPEPNMEEPIR